jgi:hypothetical protein
LAPTVEPRSLSGAQTADFEADLVINFVSFINSNGSEPLGRVPPSKIDDPGKTHDKLANFCGSRAIQGEQRFEVGE